MCLTGSAAPGVCASTAEYVPGGHHEQSLHPAFHATAARGPSTYTHTHTHTDTHTLKLRCILYIRGNYRTESYSALYKSVAVSCIIMNCMMSVQVLGKLNDVIINCKALPMEVRIHIIHVSLWEPCTPFHTYVNTTAETDGPRTGI